MTVAWAQDRANLSTRPTGAIARRPLTETLQSHLYALVKLCVALEVLLASDSSQADGARARVTFAQGPVALSTRCWHLYHLKQPI